MTDFTLEFYLALWEKIKTPLISSFRFVFKDFELSISQKQEVIKLIDKKAGIRDILKTGAYIFTKF